MIVVERDSDPTQQELLVGVQHDTALGDPKKISVGEVIIVPTQ